VRAVRTEDMILVSVDDHVVEPAHMFQGRLPKQYEGKAPKFVHRDDGTDVWVYEGIELVNIGLNAVAGRPPEEYGFEPTALEEIRPGCYDIDARIKDMNANGVLGSMCFPSFPQFCGQLFMRTEDKDQARAMVQAYNDWHIDEWCGTHPGRMIPLALPMLWNPEWLADEMRRVAAKGCHAVTFSENPAKLGLPSLHSDHWDPFWKACSDVGTVVCMHIGSSSQLVVTAEDAPIDVLMVLSPINIVQAAADLVFSPVLRKFPSITIALSEGGIGWIPYFLERIDYVYQHHKAWTNQDFGDKLPSQVFNERMITCFIDDAFGVENRHHLNIDNITWECDYPHSDSTWPQAPELAMKYLQTVPDDEINKITHLNAMRLWQFDPFKLRPRQQCTVDALRSEAAGWDVTIRSTSVIERDSKARGSAEFASRSEKIIKG
jgi:predicted TIM-barrel fold metal-dependent hydrolase